MYFINFLAKKIFGTRKKANIGEVPNFEQKDEVIEDCEEHVFMPIDSTGEVLSCINCGRIVHKEELHKNNPF